MTDDLFYLSMVFLMLLNFGMTVVLAIKLFNCECKKEEYRVKATAIRDEICKKLVCADRLNPGIKK